MIPARSLSGRIVSAFTAALAACVVSCDRGDVLERFEEKYARGNCREAVLILRHHFRQGGRRTPELLFAAGRGMLCLGNEAEAAEYFRAAAEADSVWTARIADALRREALASFEQGQPARGRRFMLQTISYGEDNDFGAYDVVAGELLLERRQYAQAIEYLRRYLARYPDTTAVSEVILVLGEAYEGAEQTELAIELYQGFTERFPTSRLRPTAQYRLERLLLETGERLAAAGEYEQARRLLEQLAATAASPLTLERTHFLLGGIAEAEADFELAVLHYRRIVHLNPGSSGRLVERAKERIERIESDRIRRR